MPRPIPHPAKALLVARGEPLREAAAAVGVNAHTFGRIVNGHLAPWPKLRLAVAEHLGVDEADAWHDEPSAAAHDINARANAADASAEAVQRVATILRHARGGATDAA